MSAKYRGRYRISSSRASWWNYGNGGYYFVTLCTRNKVHYFGEIQGVVMQKSTLGKLAEKYWNEIPIKFSFVTLGEFIVMPNHIHGIIIIDKGNIDFLD